MFERVVLGVDPGTAATGFAVLRGGAGRPQLLAAGTVRTPSGAPEPARLQHLHRAFLALVEEHSPESMAVERLLWGRNVGSAMSVARASGVALLVAAQGGLPVREYSPMEVKLAVTGDGSASKEAVRRGLEKLHGLGDLPPEPDAADAVAVALCHVHVSRSVLGAGS